MNMPEQLTTKPPLPPKIIPRKQRDLNVADLPAIYELLAKEMPREAIQEAQTKEFKGYDSIGFGYQWIVNRLNDAIGIGHWRMMEENIGEPIPQGTKMVHVTKKIKIQIGNWAKCFTNENSTLNGIYTSIPQESFIFQILAEQWSYGGHSAKALSDAHKGAQTNGLKKCAAMFGAGRQAYEATLDEDNRDVDKVYQDLPEEKQSKVNDWKIKINEADTKAKLIKVGEELKKIKGEREMVLILRSEYNKRLLVLNQKEAKPKKDDNS